MAHSPPILHRASNDNMMIHDLCTTVTVKNLKNEAQQCRSSVLDDVYKAAREQSRPAVSLQCPFEPAILPLPVYKHNVALLKF